MIETLLFLLMGARPPMQAPPVEPALKHAVMAPLEKRFDGQIDRRGNDPMELLGNTRGIYLKGYGAVFTAEVDLIMTPSATNPFRAGPMTQQEINRIHDRKVKQLPVLKQVMREMLLHSAQALDAVPLQEQIVVGVSLFLRSWENTSGLPAQLVMRSERGKLLQKNVVDSAIQTEEF